MPPSYIICRSFLAAAVLLVQKCAVTTLGCCRDVKFCALTCPLSREGTNCLLLLTRSKMAPASQDEDSQIGDESHSGDESDGYGDDGLSWEAVMQGLQQNEDGERHQAKEQGE